MPPLYRITSKKNEYTYLKDDKALAEYISTHQGEKYLINRIKGLGEQDSHELYDALLNPEARNVEQLIVKDVQETDELIDMFNNEL